jgi:hypothetical protein
MTVLVLVLAAVLAARTLVYIPPEPNEPPVLLATCSSFLSFTCILSINMNHQKLTFHPLGDFLNPALALLGQGLKKSPIGQKLDFANHPYLCKGL